MKISTVDISICYLTDSCLVSVRKNGNGERENYINFRGIGLDFNQIN